MTDRDGKTHWALIPQMEHARLAAELLAAWPAFPEVAQHSALAAEVAWVTRHHDDGWLDWDAQPGLDADGRPYEFREVPDPEIMPIWSRSIDLAEARSPLAAHLVAAHFLVLAGDDQGTLPFKAREQPRCEQNLTTWLRTAGRGVTREQTHTALEILRLFDWFSLLLCIKPLTEPVSLPLPTGLQRTELASPRLVPAGIEHPFQLSIDPWPMSERRSWSGSIDCQLVPARAYQDVQQMKQAARPCHLCWTLTPPA